jgi:hypothetical protein
MLNALRLVHKNTPPNQNIRFKANVIKIPRSIFGYLTAMITNCLPLVQDWAAIIMFDKKKRGDAWIWPTKKADFYSNLIIFIIR